MKSFTTLKNVIAVAAVIPFATGCASVVNDPTHKVRIDAVAQTGQLIEGAACVAFNDRGMTALKSGGAESVRRSSDNLHVVCTHPGQPIAVGLAKSRGNAGLAGNLVIGGLVGAAVDHSLGTGYTYPTWIRLEFGRALVFDRNAETAGQPVIGYPAGSEPPTERSGSASSRACIDQNIPGMRCAK